ncbi:MAG: inorganic phosphate transporter [Patescibacteria group bacterium]|nr:inorganic phosphate transporter [Patescibacteria group bacterium]
MDTSLIFVIVIVVIASLYNFYNGANDCANSIATTVSTRVLSIWQAVFLAGVLNFAGAFLTTEVAKTIGKGIIPEEHLTEIVIIAAILGAVAWAAIATHMGAPVSITHCMVGGLMGAGLAAYGFGGVNWEGLKKIGIGMVTSPIGGFIVGVILIVIIYHLFKKWRPQKANFLFGKLQVVSASFMALTHGTNDSQNAMGIITAALFAAGYITDFEVPFWVILISAFFMGIGTLIGGKSVIKTVGMKMTDIKPVQGFAAETSASFVILIASFLGIPISTTHTISTSVMGVGASRRLSAVRWTVVKQIIWAWIITIPFAALVAALCYYGINYFIA